MEYPRLQSAIWLVNHLLNYRRLSLRDLSSFWQRDQKMSGGQEMSRLRLSRMIDSAFELLGVVIECDRRDGYRYFIAANENLKAAEWLISSHAINDVILSSTQVRDRILLEEIPSGQHHLSLIVEAMRQGKALEMVYRKFADSDPYTCLVEPYCVKLSQQRWYLLACKDHRDHLQVFALDRIQQLTVLIDQPFTPPADFSPADYFANRLGVYVGDHLLIQEVRLRVNAFWRNYLRTLPMHPSQTEPEVHHDYSIFCYQLAITPDLLNQLLSYGPHVEVLSPPELRQMMCDAATRMAASYASH